MATMNEYLEKALEAKLDEAKLDESKMDKDEKYKQTLDKIHDAFFKFHKVYIKEFANLYSYKTNDTNTKDFKKLRNDMADYYTKFDTTLGKHLQEVNEKLSI